MTSVQVTRSASLVQVTATRPQVAVGTPSIVVHNVLSGRSTADAHPTAAITGLDAALALKAPLASPTLTGTPKAGEIQASTTAGLTIKNSAGTTVAVLGAGPSTATDLAGPLSVPQGSVSAPSIVNASAPTTGLYWGATAVVFAVAGNTVSQHGVGGSTWTSYSSGASTGIVNTLRGATGSEASPGPVLDGYLLGRLQFGGYYDSSVSGSGSGYDGNQAYIDTLAVGDWTAGSAALRAKLRFAVATAAGGGASFAGQINPGSVWNFGISSDAVAAFTGGTSTPTVQIVGTTSADQSRLALVRFDANASDCPSVIAGKTGSSTLGNYAAVASGNTLFVLAAEGADGTDLARACSIRALVDGAVSADDVPGRWEFHTANASGTETLALTINSSQQAIFAAGSAAAPAVAVGATDQGLYRISSTAFGIAVGGVLQATVNSLGQITTAAGSAASPSFAVESDSGMYRVGNDTIGFSTGGVLALTINASRKVVVASTADGALNVPGKITAKVAVPGSFADLAAVQSYLASILT